MPVYALEVDDFCEEEYSLVGIHSALEDYKVAYLLNKNLSTKFYKAKEDLEFVREKTKVSFSIYNYENSENDFDWFLIANSCRREKISISKDLLLSSETKTYLIPEKKKVDFFLKISGIVEYEFVLRTINKIKNIENVITAFSIDKNTLKSKDFLIF